MKFLYSRFKYVQGVLHLHNSSLGSHGWLTPSNCLVNTQWRLLITDYGLQKFRNRSLLEDVDDDYKRTLRVLNVKLIEKRATDMSTTLIKV